MVAALDVEPSVLAENSGLAARVARVMAIMSARLPTERELGALPADVRTVFAEFMSARSSLEDVGQEMDRARERGKAEHEEHMRELSELSMLMKAAFASRNDADVWRAYLDASKRMGESSSRGGVDDAIRLTRDMQAAMGVFNQKAMCLTRLLVRFV